MIDPVTIVLIAVVVVGVGTLLFLIFGKKETPNQAVSEVETAADAVVKAEAYLRGDANKITTDLKSTEPKK